MRAEMQKAVDRLAFEEAARLRDRMRAMEMTLEKQHAVTTDRKDRDIINIVSDEQALVVNVLSQPSSDCGSGFDLLWAGIIWHDGRSFVDGHTCRCDLAGVRPLLRMPHQSCPTRFTNS